MTRSEMIDEAVRSVRRFAYRCGGGSGQVFDYFRVTELALHRGPSIDFAGYYQRHVTAA